MIKIHDQTFEFSDQNSLTKHLNSVIKIHDQTFEFGDQSSLTKHVNPEIKTQNHKKNNHSDQSLFAH